MATATATKAKTAKSNGEPVEAKAKAAEAVSIKPINMQVIELTLVGTAPLKQAAFTAKAMQAMRAKQEAGDQAKKGGKRKPRDFESDFKEAMHVSTEGWVGIPASAFRNACIDVCRMVGYKMTYAKMSIFVEHDGFDAVNGAPLVRLQAKAPEKTEEAVRNANGVVDIRVRPMWRDWRVKIRVKFDADQFSANDVINLFDRAGQQVGIGEGRPFSKSSNGTGNGTFRVERG